MTLLPKFSVAGREGGDDDCLAAGGATQYALEGNIAMTGAARARGWVSFLVWLSRVEERSQAGEIRWQDSEGVYFVPAMSRAGRAVLGWTEAQGCADAD